MSIRDNTRDSRTSQRERMLSMIGGLLGVLMFAIGFMRWLSIGDGADQSKYSGYAFQMPTTAIIGFSLAAGLIAVLGATERRAGRGVPSAIPTGLAATSLLLAVAVYLGKGAISPELGDEVGVEPGLILGIATAAAQTLVLGMGLSSRHDDDDYDTRFIGESSQAARLGRTPEETDTQTLTDHSRSTRPT